MQYRLAYLAYTDVNWCEALGTVLANDEVINGVSYRGGYPGSKKTNETMESCGSQNMPSDFLADLK